MDGRRSCSSSAGMPTVVPSNKQPPSPHPDTPTSPTSTPSSAATSTTSIGTPAASSASSMGVGGVLPGAVSSAVPANKILGRNTNGTVVMTSVPSNEAELQLYRVMQRASLLAYYDTLLEMGGDDVQQLCEAGEEEFLEIMALVGMASKPLHVRRLQKALQEWFNNPAQFQIPLGPTPAFPVAVPRAAVAPPVVGTPLGTPSGLPSARSPPRNHSSPNPTSHSPAPSVPAPLAGEHLSRSAAASPASPRCPRSPVDADPMQTGVGSIPIDFTTPSTTTTATAAATTPTPTSNNHHLSPHYPSHDHLLPLHNHNHLPHTSPSTSPLQASGGLGPGRPLSAPLSSPTPSRPLSPSLQLTPVLLESQIQRLEEAARNLSRTLPSYQPRPHNTKKKICKDLELVINMSDGDPRRMDEIRKYAAIYGRFDCKRKPEKPLTLHEVSVNEAAAQICRFVPALLTRRDELFPLARQVVRDSGYLYSKGHTNLSYYRPRCPNGDDILTAGHKRPKLDPNSSPSPDSSEGHGDRPEQRQRRQERLEAVAEELRALAERHEDLLAATGPMGALGHHDVAALQAVRDALLARQTALQAEQAELMRQTPRSVRVRSSSLTMDSDRGETDDDSQLSFSNASSPSQEIGDSRDSEVAERTSRSPLKTGSRETPLEAAALGNGFTDGFYSESKVQVIASRGSDIIAVANPALSMSSALLEAKNKSPVGGSSPGGRGGAGGSPPTSPKIRHNDMLKLEPQSPPASPGKVQ